MEKVINHILVKEKILGIIIKSSYVNNVMEMKHVLIILIIIFIKTIFKIEDGVGVDYGIHHILIQCILKKVIIVVQ